MPDQNSYVIRTILPEEAMAASNFAAQNAGNYYRISRSFCLHHADTTFIRIDSSGEWQGLIVTYISPADRHTAVIECMVVAGDKRGKGIGSELLKYVLQFYKDQCVFSIKAYREKETELFKGLLGKFEFTGKSDGSFCKRLLPEKICLHNRRMRPKMNTVNGEINEETLFEYFQKGDTIWGIYSGGTIERGVLLGKMARNGNINFQYLQINIQQEVSTGISHSVTEFLNDGRIILYEDWEWTGNKSGGGLSVIEEIKE